MAILNKFTVKRQGLDDVTIDNAYWRINTISGGKLELLVSVEILQSIDSNSPIGLFSFTFKPDTEGANYHSQAYEYMKGMEFFSGAVDA